MGLVVSLVALLALGGVAFWYYHTGNNGSSGGGDAAPVVVAQADDAASGGEAKMVISEGLVLVNGKVETRKRKKIVAGDTIEFGQEILRIECANKD